MEIGDDREMENVDMTGFVSYGSDRWNDRKLGDLGGIREIVEWEN